MARVTAPLSVGPGDHEALAGRIEREADRRRGVAGGFDRCDRGSVVAQPGGRVAHDDRGALVGHRGDAATIGRCRDQARPGGPSLSSPVSASTMVAVGSRGVAGHDHEPVVVDPGRRGGDDRSVERDLERGRDRRIDQHDPDVVAGRQVAAERRVATAARLPARERVRSTVRVAVRADGLDRPPLELLAEMERVAGLRRPVRQGGGEDAGQARIDPGRLALGERDLVGSSPLSSQPTRSCRWRSRRARASHREPTRPTVPRSSRRRGGWQATRSRAPRARGAARSSCGRFGAHRRGKCATPMPWLIARSRASSRSPSRVRRRSRRSPGPTTTRSRASKAIGGPSRAEPPTASGPARWPPQRDPRWRPSALAGADGDRRARKPRAVRAAAPGERTQLTGDRVAALDRERRGQVRTRSSRLDAGAPRRCGRDRGRTERARSTPVPASTTARASGDAEPDRSATATRSTATRPQASRPRHRRARPRAVSPPTAPTDADPTATSPSDRSRADGHRSHSFPRFRRMLACLATRRSSSRWLGRDARAAAGAAG